MKSSAPVQRKGARVVIPKKPSAEGDVDNKLFKENMKRYEQDLVILSKKIADCQGDSNPVPGLVLPTQPESLFVNNLRNSVGSANNENTLRLNILERIMGKLTELDRVILKKTDLGQSTTRPRRKSKDGSDLFSLPTHLLMVDRLLDVFAMSQRLQIIEKEKGGSKSVSSKESSIDLEKKNQEIEKLKKSLADAEVAKEKYKRFANEKDAEFEKLKREQNKGANTPRGDNSKLTVIGDGKAIVAVEVGDNRSKEISELKSKLEKSEQKVRDMEERMEIIAASEQGIISAIASMTFAMSNSNEIPTPDKLNLKVQNPDAKLALDQLSSVMSDLLMETSNAAKGQSNVITQERELLQSEFDAYKSTSQTEMARKNAEILELQESLSKAYNANEKAGLELKQTQTKNAESRKELIVEYEKKIQDFRADNASSASVRRQLEKTTANLQNLEKKYTISEDKNIELKHIVDSLKSEITALEKLNHNLKETVKKMTNDANKNDFADTFEEVMREEMMSMKSAFEAKLRIAQDQVEVMSKKRLSEIRNIEGSKSTSGFR